jgi:hypothetical protein
MVWKDKSLRDVRDSIGERKQVKLFPTLSDLFSYIFKKKDKGRY